MRHPFQLPTKFTNLRTRFEAAAFTLIELLVVISIIGVLIAMLIPALSQAKAITRQMVCQQTLRGMISATITYTTDLRGQLPASRRSPWYYYPYYPNITGWHTLGSNAYMDYLAAATTDPIRLAGVGWLMAGRYLPETKKAFACPQTDYRENRGFSVGEGSLQLMNYDTKDSYGYEDTAYHSALNPNSGPGYYKNCQAYNGMLTTYITRGMVQDSNIKKLYRSDLAGYYGGFATVTDSAFAYFWDHEAADQSLVPYIGLGLKSPLLGWAGRVHTRGINAAYMDGHVYLFPDEDRSITWWGRGAENYNYGNGNGSSTYDLDQ